MALAMPVPKHRDSGTYMLRPLVKTQVSRVGSENANLREIASLFGRMTNAARPVCQHSWKATSAPSRKFPFGTWSDNSVSMGDDAQKYVVCLLTVACHYEDTGQQLVSLEQQDVRVATYGIATFIPPIEYAWTEEFFAAEEALKVYLSDSHADH